jgi:hypothetical protein
MNAGMDFPTDQIAELAKQGSGWLIAIILGFVIGYLWRDAKTTAKACAAEREAARLAFEAERASSWAARLKTWEEVGAIMREQNVVQSQLTTARENGSAATNAMAEASRLQAAVMTRLIEAVDRAIISNESLKETILTKVVRP